MDTLRQVESEINTVSAAIPQHEAAVTTKTNTYNDASSIASREVQNMQNMAGELRILDPMTNVADIKLNEMERRFRKTLIAALESNGLQVGVKFTPEMISTDGYLYIEM